MCGCACASTATSCPSAASTRPSPFCSSHADTPVALPLGAPIAYIRQFTVAAEARPQSQSALRTIHPLPFITAPAESLRLSVSFLPDAVGAGRGVEGRCCRASCARIGAC